MTLSLFVSIFLQLQLLTHNEVGVRFFETNGQDRAPEVLGKPDLSHMYTYGTHFVLESGRSDPKVENPTYDHLHRTDQREVKPTLTRKIHPERVYLGLKC